MPCSARTWNSPFSVSPTRSALRPPSPRQKSHRLVHFASVSAQYPSARVHYKSGVLHRHWVYFPSFSPKLRRPFSFFLRANPFPEQALCVATAAWQRCYGGVATLLWRRGNVVTGAWQPVGPHLVAGRRLASMTRRLLLFAKRLSVCFFRAAVSISSISSIFPLLSACSHPAPVHPLWPPRISCKFYLVLRGCQLLP